MTDPVASTVHVQTADALRRLTSFTSALTWDQVPADLQARVARVFWDDFGAMVAARNEPELVQMRALLARSTGPAEARVWDGAQPALRMDRYSAALANGTAADWAELDGGYRAVV